MAWDVYKVNGSPAGFLNPVIPGKDPRIEDEVLPDPIQKNTSDCFLIAALNSCAWNVSATNIPLKLPNFGSSFTFPFYWYDQTQPLKPATAFTTKATSVSNTLFLDTRGVPVYAQPTPAQEIWGAVYEKAFAKFKGCPLDADGNPDVAIMQTLLKPGDALSVLVNLTKKKFSFDTVFLPQTAFLAKNAPPTVFNGQPCTDYFDVIKTVCSPTALSGKTRYPMVAWTYDSEDYTPAWKAMGFRYRDATNNRMLLPKHTYSILGYYKPTGGSKCIVLRDPLGSVPRGDAFISSYLSPAPPDSSYYWDPVGDATKFTPRNISLCSDGVFGLRVDAFTGCFSGFGWVQ
jgi:hypothetical protein